MGTVTLPQFYDFNNFVNVVYSTNIKLYNYFVDTYLRGYSDRMLYVNTENALRERVLKKQTKTSDPINQKLAINTGDFPFINFWIDNIVDTTDRPWYNHTLNTDGYYVPELGKKFKLLPITIEYDSTYFTTQHLDAVYIQNLAMFDNGAETMLDLPIEVNGVEINLPFLLGYNLDFKPTYKSEDYLEKNNIHTLQLNPTVQTFLILENSNDFAVSLSKEIVFNFTNNMEDVDDTTTYDERIELIESSFNCFN